MRPGGRRLAILAAVAAVVGSAGFAAAVDMQGATTSAPPPPLSSTSPPSSTPALSSTPAYAAAARPGLSGPAPAAQGSAFPACEDRIEQAKPTAVPRLAVVGASFTAGVGSGPGHSWAVQLASRLRWDAAVYGVPGAGYVRPGTGQGGPVASEIAHVGLGALAPSLIIVQAGHDDIGVPPAVERQRVTQAIDLIRAQAPAARIALLTVFASSRSASPAASRTDQAIVAAARAADHSVIIIDPLTGRWSFPRVRDGLHPTAAGSAWIAGQVAAVLDDHGVRPATGPAPVICDHAWP